MKTNFLNSSMNFTESYVYATLSEIALHARGWKTIIMESNICPFHPFCVLADNNIKFEFTNPEYFVYI